MAVPEEEIPLAAGRMAVREGVYPCYEGAAAYLALERLLDEEHISKSDTVVVFNTGTGLINPGEEPPPIPVLDDPESLRGLLGR
jgi:threonine synthase